MEKNDTFKIMKNTKVLVSDVVEFSRNFPKSEAVLMKDFIVSLSMVDYYFEYLYLNKIISFKKYKGLVDEVVTIRKLAYGVLKNEKELC